MEELGLHAVSASCRLLMSLKHQERSAAELRKKWFPSPWLKPLHYHQRALTGSAQERTSTRTYYQVLVEAKRSYANVLATEWHLAKNLQVAHQGIVKEHVVTLEAGIRPPSPANPSEKSFARDRAISTRTWWRSSTEFAGDERSLQRLLTSFAHVVLAL